MSLDVFPFVAIESRSNFLVNDGFVGKFPAVEKTSVSSASSFIRSCGSLLLHALLLLDLFLRMIFDEFRLNTHKILKFQ